MTSGITLLVDIGNSRVKWAQVNEQNLTGLGEAAHGESPTHALKAMVDAQPGTSADSPSRMWVAEQYS